MSPIPGLSPETDLMDTYGRWRQWTEVEGLAICAEDWPRVTECQEAKRELQPVILRFTSQVLSCTSDPARFHQRVRTVVQELITLEHHNNQIISRKREQLQAQRDDLDRSSQNLRRLHSSYAPTATPNWQSFS